MRPYILAETTWKALKDQSFDMAILPWGATEAHNLHLPYSTDNIATEAIVAESARLAWDKGFRAVVLPCVPFGVNTGQLDIRINLNLKPSTQLLILDDIADVLNRHGIKKLMILNGHGGNDFKQMIRELGMKYPAMFICTCNWYQSFDNSMFFENEGGHADEMETSLMLYISPDMVLPISEAGKGEAKKFRIKALNEKWAWAERKWSEVTSDTGIGDPSLASAEKGKRCFSEVTEKLAGLIADLCKTDNNNMYVLNQKL
jgi:creatinine amidohydrolase